MASETADLAERMAWRRARMATILAMVFITAQAGSFHDELTLNRPQAIQLVAWMIWAGALLLFLALSGGLLKGPRMRALLNDETTQDHRRRAMVTGFWAAIGTCFLVYAATFYEQVNAREGVRLVVTLSIAIALMRFGTLERRALKAADG